MGLPNRDRFTVAIQVFDEFEDVVCASWLEDVCRAAQHQELIHDRIHDRIKGHVSLVIADDETVRSLNAGYRGLDRDDRRALFRIRQPGGILRRGGCANGMVGRRWLCTATGRVHRTRRGDSVVPPGSEASAAGRTFHRTRTCSPDYARNTASDGA